MSRQRKLRIGKTNNRLGGLDSTSTLTTKSYQSATAKTIRPAAYDLPPADTRRRRHITDTSSWTPGMIYVRDFVTQNKQTFQDPSIHIDTQDQLDIALEEERKEWEANRIKERGVAITKLGDIAKKKFGSMNDMLRAFKKTSSDTITLPEFAENLRRRKLDAAFPPEDQALVFEELKATARGSISAGSLSKTVDGKADHGADKVLSGEMAAMREFLKQQIEEKRATEEQAGGQDEAKGVEGVIQGGSDMMKKAIGQRTFDLDVGAEEMNQVVEELFKKQHTAKAHQKFSRFLRLTNVKLHAIPFYDMRQDSLDRLKQNVKAIEDVASSPSVAGRLSELKTKRINTIRREYAETLDEGSIYNNSTFGQTTLGSPDPELLAQERSAMQRKIDQEEQQYQLQQQQQQQQQQRAEEREEGPQSAQIPPSPLYSARDSARERDSFLSPMRAPNSMQKSQSERIIPTYSPTRTATSDLITGGDDLSVDLSMYRSSYNEYFPPLHYEPNMPVTRTIISDADGKIEATNLKRKIRAQRTNRNMNITKERLEMEELQAMARSLRKKQTMNEDMIR